MNNINNSQTQYEHEIRMLLNELEREKEGFLNTIIPKRHIVPRDYLPPKMFASGIYDAITFDAGFGEEALAVKQISIQSFIDLYSPTYYINEGFFDLVNNTDLDKSATFEQLHFPMKSFLLVMSNKSFINNNGISIQFCLVTQHEKHLYIIIAYIINGLITVQSSWLVMEGKLEQTYNALTQLSPVNTSHIDNATEFVLKLLLILSTKPSEFIEADNGIPSRAEKRRKNGTLKKEGLWNPLWIGKPQHRYAHVCGGVGSKKAMHYRRGHIRNQRHGINRCLSKCVWIKPQIIGSDEIQLAE